MATDNEMRSQLKGQEDNAMRSQLNGQEVDVVRPDFEALELTFRRIADREAMSQNLPDPNATPDWADHGKQSLTSTNKINPREGSVFPPPLTSTGNINPREGSVFQPPASLSQNYRFSTSTVFRPDATPISPPVFAGFPRGL